MFLAYAVSMRTHKTLSLLFQEKNPVVKHIRNVPIVFEQIEPDYLLGKNAFGLFLRHIFSFCSFAGLCSNFLLALKASNTTDCTRITFGGG